MAAAGVSVGIVIVIVVTLVVGIGVPQLGYWIEHDWLQNKHKKR